MIEILDFINSPKGILLGYLSIRIPKWGNFEIHGLCVFQKNKNRWISFPTKKSDEKFIPVCNFKDKSLQEKFFNEIKKSFDVWMEKNNPPLFFQTNLI